MSPIEPNALPSSQPRLTSAQKQQYDMRVQNIAKAVEQQRCILFLGSAIHAEAPEESTYEYPVNKRPPKGSELSRRLATKCSYPDGDLWNLPRVAWYYEWVTGFRSYLIDEVNDALRMNQTTPVPAATEDESPRHEYQPSPILRGLARLGFPIVITTNYDQLYERALDMVAQEAARAAGDSEEHLGDIKANYHKSVYSPSETVLTVDCDSKPSSQRPYLLKIHGDLDDPDSIVITDEDYIQFILRMGDKDPYRPVGEHLRFYLKTWPTLFIGYRLGDYNLRLLFKTLRRQLGEARIPASFAVDLEPDVLIRETWDNKRGYIRFIEKNLWDFVPDLYRATRHEEMPL